MPITSHQSEANHRTRTSILGIPFSTITLQDLTQEAINSIFGPRNKMILSFANPHSIIVARSDGAFRQALLNANFVLPDGIGVVLAARLLQQTMDRRIAGWDFFDQLMRRLESKGEGRVFFFGSSASTLEKIAARFSKDSPHIELCGLLSPPFGEWSEEQDAEFIKIINDSHADVLWVGMTAPKQECWVEKNRDRLHVPIIGSIGAVFDFYAGTAVRAPVFIQKAGFEWLHRLLKNPRRLWRRTFISGMQFVALVLCDALTALPRSFSR